MEILFVIIFLLGFVAIVWYSLKEFKTNNLIYSAKNNGILINGKHFNVYTVFRRSDEDKNDVHNYGEIMLVSPDKERTIIHVKHLLYCLKVRKHESKRTVGEGKMTNKWAEWEIDTNWSGQRSLSPHQVYLSLESV